MIWGGGQLTWDYPPSKGAALFAGLLLRVVVMLIKGLQHER